MSAQQGRQSFLRSRSQPTSPNLTTITSYVGQAMETKPLPGRSKALVDDFDLIFPRVKGEALRGQYVFSNDPGFFSVARLVPAFFYTGGLITERNRVGGGDGTPTIDDSFEFPALIPRSQIQISYSGGAEFAN
ncbi:hypothetical protein BP5796_11603 [Coleophoma crateriformis]|uniref:Uncharacterized protein n=1 Tax=Coleophoma crateriformis TaxID=565419 RepID=A0A3D8QE41_9HELO|nr:hypothetical protein BP5796_11603 [Coleophoma crateriformis]